MTLLNTRVTAAIAALVTLGLAACTDSPGPTGVAPGSRDLASANARQAFPTGLASVGWQAEARGLVATPATTAPPVAVRIYALLGVAQYGALVDADKNVDADGLLESADGGRRRFEARRGAVAGASYRVLSSIFPNAAATLAQRLSEEGEAGPGGVHPYFTRGVAIGDAWGRRMLARADGSTTPFTGTYPAPNTGYWVTNPGVPPAVPQYGAMKPYFMTSPGQFHPPAPPAVGSPEFVTDLAEVTAIAFARTAAQLDTAATLNLGNGTMTSLGYWDVLATQYIAERGFDERGAAHVFALTNAATMDAVIGCWEAKYSYFYIRPWHANPALVGTTLLPLGRPNHPSYPSGHSCVSAAAAEVNVAQAARTA